MRTRARANVAFCAHEDRHAVPRTIDALERAGTSQTGTAASPRTSAAELVPASCQGRRQPPPLERRNLEGQEKKGGDARERTLRANLARTGGRRIWRLMPGAPPAFPTAAGRSTAIAASDPGQPRDRHRVSRTGIAIPQLFARVYLVAMGLAGLEPYLSVAATTGGTPESVPATSMLCVCVA